MGLVIKRVKRCNFLVNLKVYNLEYVSKIKMVYDANMELSLLLNDVSMSIQKIIRLPYNEREITNVLQLLQRILDEGYLDEGSASKRLVEESLIGLLRTYLQGKDRRVVEESLGPLFSQVRDHWIQEKKLSL